MNAKQVATPLNSSSKPFVFSLKESTSFVYSGKIFNTTERALYTKNTEIYESYLKGVLWSSLMSVCAITSLSGLTALMSRFNEINQIKIKIKIKIIAPPKRP